MAVGGYSHEVLLVEAGVVKVLLPAGGGVDIVVGLHGPGALLGELGVLDGRPRSATVIGHADGIATHIAGPAFRELVGQNSDVRELADATQHQRLRNADRRQLAVVTMNVRDRTVSQLLDWAKSYGERTGAGVVLRGLSRRDLAGAVLASVQHVDAVLRELRTAGLLDTSRMRFVLLDPARLARLLDEE